MQRKGEWFIGVKEGHSKTDLIGRWPLLSGKLRGNDTKLMLYNNLCKSLRIQAFTLI